MEAFGRLKVKGSKLKVEEGVKSKNLSLNRKFIPRIQGRLRGLPIEATRA